MPYVDGLAPNLMNFSFNFKYHNLLAFWRPYMHFYVFHILFVVASFGYLWKTVHFISIPCKNAVLMSNEFSVHVFDAVVEQKKEKTFSGTNWNMSVLKFCSSSKSLAHSLSFTSSPLSTYFSLITHLIEIHSWPWLDASL